MDHRTRTMKVDRMTTGDAHMERSPRFISMVRMAKNAETASTLVITSASISSRRASLASARLRRRQESFELVIVIVLSVAHRRPRTESLLVNQGESLEHALNGGPSGAEALPGRFGGVK